MKNIKKIKKILLINPYLDTLGGGEKHTLSILERARDLGFMPFIAWENKKIVKDIQSRFNMNFTSDSIVSYYSKNPIARLLMTKKYDVIIYVHDGSYFFSLAKRNFIYSMYPKKSLYKRTILNTIKWINWKFISISNYTKSFIDQWTKKSSFLLFPPIDVKKRKGIKKQHIILSIGRFFKHLHAKKQDELIDAFSKLKRIYPRCHSYKLVLVGGMQEKDKKYVDELKKKANDVGGVEIKTNVLSDELDTLLQRAKIYWHGTGLGMTSEDPSVVEHFGIAPFEAMMSGCVTFCVNSGEPSRVIIDGENGFLYETKEELIRKTAEIENNKVVCEKIMKKAEETVKKKFSRGIFNQRVKELLE